MTMFPRNENSSPKPYPWTFELDEDHKLIVYDKGGNELAEVFGNLDVATLMAAAPMLLDCVREACKQGCDGCAFAEWNDGKCKCEKGDNICPVDEWMEAVKIAEGKKALDSWITEKMEENKR